MHSSNNKGKRKHCFAICAYGESPYLEACIRSVKSQTVTSDAVLMTSTPNKHIRRLAEKYEIPLLINRGESGITQDWNFAYAAADAEYVTITHQDDIYGRRYLENVLRELESADTPMIFFSDYGELRDGRIVTGNRLLLIKKILLFPLRFSHLQKSIFVRRRVLSLGSSICCPSVTYVKKNLPEVIFRHHFRSDEDWEAWERLSKREGSFVYCPKVLMLHRIHAGSETTKILQDNSRTAEDLEMFRKFWPESVAKWIARIYSSSEKSNRL